MADFFDLQEKLEPPTTLKVLRFDKKQKLLNFLILQSHAGFQSPVRH